jgi:hypothetical protein
VWTDIRRPKPINRVTTEVPPRETKGKGSPITGRSPETIAILTNIYKKKTKEMLPASKRPKLSRALKDMYPARIRTDKYKNISTATPSKPNSSAKTAMIKSVLLSGIKSRCD